MADPKTAYTIDIYANRPVVIPAASESSAGVLTAADKTKLDGLSGNTPVSGTVVEQMGGLPASLSLPGAKVGQKVVMALGTNAGVPTNCAADFEATISVVDHIKQLSLTVANSGTVMILVI